MTAMGPSYKVQFRRKREGKTDYKRRLKFLRSVKPRLTVRVSLNHISAQVIQPHPSGDVALVSAHSKQLEAFGWKGGTSNMPSAYLVGLLCGCRAIKSGVKESTFDIGMKNPTPGSKVFSALRGALDGGLQIPHDEAILPGDERLNGLHIAKYASKLREADEKKYRSIFSGYLARGLEPEHIPDHFNSVKREIISKFGGKDGNEV